MVLKYLNNDVTYLSNIDYPCNILYKSFTLYTYYIFMYFSRLDSSVVSVE